ncbi:hypothetical protein NMD73_06610 [Edwardsiella tarda]|uniref:hypothetical protein n=1 Tax=Edwardsiella tarda TaxID=636 RepID=UPI00351CB64F
MKIKGWVLLTSIALAAGVFVYAVLFSADKVCEHQRLFSDFCRHVDISAPYISK